LILDTDSPKEDPLHPKFILEEDSSAALAGKRKKIEHRREPPEKILFQGYSRKGSHWQIGFGCRNRHRRVRGSKIKIKKIR
jgi:hypothetical protein